MATERPTIASCPHCRAILLRTERALIHPTSTEREELLRALGQSWRDHPTTRFDGRYHRCHGREPIVFTSHDRRTTDESRDGPESGHAPYRGPHRDFSRSSHHASRLLGAALVMLLGLSGPALAQDSRASSPGRRAADRAAGPFDSLRLDTAQSNDTAGQPASSTPGSWKGLELANGRYQIVDTLREGTTGVVYLAHDRNLDTDVVVEVPTLPPEQGGGASAERFLHAVRSLARLVHPHLVKVTEVGARNGIPFVIAEHRAGGSLRFRRPVGSDGRPAPMSPRTLDPWLVDISEALDYLHTRNLVHRAVCPANIIFDENGRVALGGFGMSQALAEWSKPGAPVPKSRLEHGPQAGTAPVLAPEIVEGKPVDGKADQFALAATVYELLSGHAPFARRSQDGGTTPGDEAGRIPTALSQITPAISEPLSTAIQRGLARDPKLRFPDCPTFARAVLSAARASRPTEIAGVTPGGKEPAHETASMGESPASLTLDHRNRTPLTNKVPLGLGCGGLVVLLGASILRQRLRSSRHRVTRHPRPASPHAILESTERSAAWALDQASRSLAPTSSSRNEIRPRTHDLRPHQAELARGPHWPQLPALALPGPAPVGRERLSLPDLDPTADRPQGQLSDSLLPVLASNLRPLSSLPQPRLRSPLVPARRAS